MPEKESCPRCGALPCDWTDDPHVVPMDKVDKTVRDSMSGKFISGAIVWLGGVVLIGLGIGYLGAAHILSSSAALFLGPLAGVAWSVLCLRKMDRAKAARPRVNEKFQREERYIVLKLSHMDGNQVAKVRNLLANEQIGTIDCVVIEADWPEYEPVWRMIEERVAFAARLPKDADLA